MRIPRKIKTILTPIVLTVIGIYLVVSALNIQSFLGQGKNILDIQKIEGISKIILGIATALIALPASIEFFIEGERKHYRLLTTYVFEPLSKLDLENLTPRIADADVIPHYTMRLYRIMITQCYMCRKTEQTYIVG